MFQTFSKLYDNKDKYYYFGGTVIYCDDNEVCSVYNNVLKELPSSTNASVSA